MYLFCVGCMVYSILRLVFDIKCKVYVNANDSVQLSVIYDISACLYYIVLSWFITFFSKYGQFKCSLSTYNVCCECFFLDKLYRKARFSYRWKFNKWFIWHMFSKQFYPIQKLFLDVWHMHSGWTCCSINGHFQLFLCNFLSVSTSCRTYFLSYWRLSFSC